jgi:hypothetical protein
MPAEYGVGAYEPYVGRAHARGRALLAEADERIADLEYVNGAGYLVIGTEALTGMLDHHRSTAENVARNFETFQRVSGRDTFAEVVEWVDAVHPVLLADRRYDMNRAADAMGAKGGYVVTAGRAVTNGGAWEQIVLASAMRPTCLTIVAPPIRGRASRSRRRRSGARRSSRGTPGRRADDEPDPARYGGSRGVGAAT